LTPQEQKQLFEDTQKAFHELKTALDARDAEVKENGRITIETKGLIQKLNDRLDELETKMSRKTVEVKDKDADQVSPLMSGFEKLMRHGRKAFDENRFTAEEKSAMADLQKKSLSAQDDTKGGLFIPDDFQAQIIKKIPNFANVGSLVNRQNTSRDVLRWPTIPYSTDDINTSGVAVTWEDETDSATETDFSMGSTAVPVKKCRALIKVSNDLLEDSAVNIVDLLASLLAEAFAIEEDKVLTSGAGGKKPEGILTCTDTQFASIVSGSAAALTYDGLVNLIYGLPEQYANNGTLMFKRATVALIRQLKDSQNRPLWEPSMQVGAPAQVLGYNYKTNEHMPAVAAGAKAIVFADFKRLYTVADRVGMTIKRLDEKYADTDQVGFIARRRFGGKVTSPWAGRKQNIST